MRRHWQCRPNTAGCAVGHGPALSILSLNLQFTSLNVKKSTNTGTGDPPGQQRSGIISLLLNLGGDHGDYALLWQTAHNDVFRVCVYRLLCFNYRHSTASLSVLRGNSESFLPECFAFSSKQEPRPVMLACCKARIYFFEALLRLRTKWGWIYWWLYSNFLY